MEIAAVRWTSLQDFPDRVAAVVWTSGCNLRCPFCYNAELVLPELTERSPRVPAERVLNGLRERRGFLEGVVLTGGEPTLQADLAEFLTEARQAGLQVKLDTNGTRPSALSHLLESGLVDYVAVDIKAPPTKYAQYTRPPVLKATSLLASVERVVSLLRGGGVAYELRTTAAPGLSEQDLEAIARWIAPVDRYFLQPFVCPPESILIDESLRDRPALDPDRLRKVAADLSPWVLTEVRA